MKNNNILDCAKLLLNLKLNVKRIDDFNIKIKPKNIRQAYAIQEELKVLNLSLRNNICIGKKVGCTNIEAQKQVGIHEPFYGNLFSRYSSTNYSTLNSINFSEPYIEPEIAFIIKNDINISKAPFSIENIDELFDGFVCSIEIVDFRFNKPIDQIGIENLIANNGASDYWIKGKNIFDLNQTDLFDNPVSIYVDDKLMEEGNTNKVLDNPLNSALWLINKISKLGETMLKGQYISTGSCTKAIKLKRNQKIRAEFINLETIEFTFK